jgi:hypothetical protein
VPDPAPSYALYRPDGERAPAKPAPRVRSEAR